MMCPAGHSALSCKSQNTKEHVCSTGDDDDDDGFLVRLTIQEVKPF